ncbi:hypothetical protein SAMN02746089_00132 [Caldanaerobius fijiensis DSM 17918]|uniref:Dinitrogenase iron-molybdenum cofactor n=1 Tax=Caldanaerobius fijiensis DSM 17918 TaxID=1121256 RepID=A0A1M4SUJ3_9THEO|nr:hypothetical protein [Caldanaerobius fijiensis]SHE35881.1 hypothetical protein SAMN02746089_00132 [Caldanaerobius fijiensis DSM 17918]
MRIAAVVDNGGFVVPLPDGADILIYDTEEGKTYQYHNPGFDVETNRRATTVEFMLQKQVNVVCTVPGAFCPVSKNKAVENSIKFIRLDNNISFQEVLSDLDEYLKGISADIPDSELFKR